MNPSGLWCSECEAERRRTITAQMEAIRASFAKVTSDEGER
jgi:hypothetical protein